MMAVKRFKKKALAEIICIPLLGTIMLIAFLNTFIPTEYAVTANTIREKMDEKFPIAFKKYFTKFELSNPSLEFIGNQGSISFSCDVSLDPPAVKPKDAVIQIEGRCEYEGASLYLRDLKIVKMQMKASSKKELPFGLEKYRANLHELIQKQIMTIYKTKPVYVIKGWKGKLAGMCVKDITFTDNSITIYRKNVFGIIGSLLFFILGWVVIISLSVAMVIVYVQGGFLEFL